MREDINRETIPLLKEQIKGEQVLSCWLSEYNSSKDALNFRFASGLILTLHLDHLYNKEFILTKS